MLNIVTLYELTKIEKHALHTHEQTSMAIKTIIALLINSIVNPFLVNRFIKYNIFGDSGLADQVLDLSIYNLILGPIFKVVSVKHIFKQLKNNVLSLDKLEYPQVEYNEIILNIKKMDY